MITIPPGTSTGDFSSTVSALQTAVAAGPPKIVFPIAGSDLASVVASVPRPSANKTFVDVELQVTGPAVNYDVADRLMTIVFVNGPTLAQQLDELFPGQRKLVVTGTNSTDNISFKQKGNVVSANRRAPDGSFQPTSRVLASGSGGDDVLDATNVVTLPVWFNGGAGNDLITGGHSNDVLQGGEGTTSCPVVEDEIF